MFWTYTPVNTSKKVHSGLARWLTSAINNNNIRTIAPICAVLTVCTAALSVTHVLTQWLLVPLGGKYSPVSRRRIFLRESRSSSTRWRLCSLCTSHPGRLESFYKECSWLVLWGAPKTERKWGKKGVGGREGKKEGKRRGGREGEKGRFKGCWAGLLLWDFSERGLLLRGGQHHTFPKPDLRPTVSRAGLVDPVLELSLRALNNALMRHLSLLSAGNPRGS